MKIKFLFLSFFVCFSAYAEEPDSAYERKEIRVPDDQQKESLEAIEAPKLSKGQSAMQNGNMVRAYKHFLKELRENPCDDVALDGLLKIAKTWESQKGFQRKVLHIYCVVCKCRPNNVETLFNTARTYSNLGKEKKAIAYLTKALAVKPNYLDAISLLIKVYIRARKFDEAKCLLIKYPHLDGANQDRAALAYQSKNYLEAENLYKEFTDQNPRDTLSLRGLARSYSAQRKYKASKAEYTKLVELEPKNAQNWVEYMGVRSHTNVNLLFEGGYTKSKETDPDIGSPVVTDYYTYGAYYVNIPLIDCWRVDLKQIYFHQKEMDIFFPFGTNYNAYVNGGQLVSEVLFLKRFKWDVVLRTLGARGFNNNVIFPFCSTIRFEPGSSVIYSDSLQDVVLNAHVESFIFKNFDVIESQLMRTSYLHASYAIHPNMWLQPLLRVTFDEVFYHDSINNRRNTTNVWARFNIIRNILKFEYRFEHSNFKETTENYFTFNYQIRNTLGGIIRFDLFSKLYIEGIYQHRWEFNMGLNQPIGLFNFQAEKQRLQSEKIILKTGYRLRDKLFIEGAGHLFYTTLPYRDYNAQGSIVWQF